MRTYYTAVAKCCFRNQTYVFFAIGCSECIMNTEECLKSVNEEKENSRLRLLNLQRVLKVFGTEVVKHSNILPHSTAELISNIKEASATVRVKCVAFLLLHLLHFLYIRVDSID